MCRTLPRQSQNLRRHHRQHKTNCLSNYSSRWWFGKHSSKSVCFLKTKMTSFSVCFQTIWAKVEGTDVNINSLQNLKRAIFKDPCAMIKDQRLYNCIASVFKDHLTTPPKHLSAICRFFSSEAKFIHKPCRGRPKIGLLVAADSFKRPV